MKKLACLSSVLVLGFSAAAFAGVGNTVNSLTLDGLKEKCAQLSANEQIKPFQAVVTCKQVATEWRPSTQPGTPISVENTKEIGASFALKGYSVPFVAEKVEVGPSTAACTVLEQYTLTVPAVDLELSCDALAQVQDLSDLCGPAIDERVTADPSIQVTEPTGQIFNSCTGSTTTIAK